MFFVSVKRIDMRCLIIRHTARKAKFIASVRFLYRNWFLIYCAAGNSQTKSLWLSHAQGDAYS